MEYWGRGFEVRYHTNVDSFGNMARRRRHITFLENRRKTCAECYRQQNRDRARKRKEEGGR